MVNKVIKRPIALFLVILTIAGSGWGNPAWAAFITSGSSQWSNVSGGINYAAGNVGIGTTTPGAKLNINNNGLGLVGPGLTINSGASTDSALINLSRGGTGRISGIQYRTADANNWFGGIYYNGGSSQSNFGIGTSYDAVNQKFVITTGGNVGIGTSSPAHKLTVMGSGYFLGDTSVPNAPTDLGFFLGKSLSDENRRMEVVSPTGGVGYIDFTEPGVDYRGRLAYYLFDNSFRFYTNGAEQVRINTSGNVGIGTTNPRTKLDFASSTGDVIHVAGGQIAGLASTPTRSDHAVPLGHLQANYAPLGSGAGGLGSGTTGQTLRHNGTSWVGNSTLFNNGTNIGIGTTNPGAKLDVRDGGVRIDYTATSSTGTIGTDVGNTIDVLRVLRRGGSDANPISGVGILLGHSSWTNGSTYYPLAAIRAYESGGVWGSYLTFSTNPNDGTRIPLARMTINNTGNVGIGTTNPTAKLYVVGNGIFYQDVDWTGIGVGESSSISGGVSWRNALNRLDIATNGYGYPIAIGRVDSGYGGLYIDTSTNGANVGIGTTAPGGKLQVSGGSANWSETQPGTTKGTIHLDPANTTDHFGNAITFASSDNTNAQAGIYVRGDGSYGTKMYFATTGNYGGGAYSRMMIDWTGNVGIGSTTPNYRLSISAPSGNGLGVSGATGNAFNAGGGHVAGLNSTPLNSDHAVPLGYLQNNYSSTSSSLWSGTKNGSIWNGSAGAGNVGIGTTNPVGTLNVNKNTSGGIGGEIRISNNNGNNAGNIARLLFSVDGTTDATPNAGIENVRTSSGTYLSDLVFKIYDDSAYNEKVRITSAGNVGIGTTAPNEKLKVDGRASFSNNAITETILWPNVYDAGASRSVRNIILNSDDLLAYAVDRGYSVTSNRVPDSGTLKCMFWPTGSNCNKPYWNNVSPANPVVISITALPNLSVDRMIIVPSGRNSLPLDYKVETYDIYTVGNWVTRKNVVGETAPYIKYVDLNSQEGVQQIIITVTNAGDADQAGRFGVNNIVVTSRYQSGRFTGYAVSAAGDTIYGNLGIGTTAAPGYPLEVSGAIGLSRLVADYTGSGKSVIYTRQNGDGSGSEDPLTVRSDGLRWQRYDGGLEYMAIRRSGWIGIGTATPVAKLAIGTTDNTAIYAGGRYIAGLDLTPINSDHAVSLWYLQNNYSSTSSSLWGGTKNGNIWNGSAGAGNVGIGTTGPDSKLHIVGGAYNSGIKIESSSIDGSGITLKNTSSGGTSYNVFSTGSNNSPGAGAFAIYDTDYRLVIKAGNVGIGATNPNKQLTFGQSPTDAIQIRRLTTSQGNPAVGTGISWTWNGGSPSENETWAAIRVILPGSTNSHMTFSTTPVSGGGAGLAERMRIQDNGNVGIGVTNPGSALHVYGGATSSRISISRAGTPGMVGFMEYPAGVMNIGTVGSDGLNLQTANVTRFSLGASGGVSVANGNNFSVNSNTLLVNSASSTVGVGTSTPVAKLAVSGGTGNVIYTGGGQISGLPSTQTEPDQATSRKYVHDNFAPIGTGVGSAFVQGGNSFGTTATLGTNDNNLLNIETNNAVRMTVAANGNVGIGTTGPLTLLHVSGLATFNSSGRFASNGNGFYFGEQSVAYRNPGNNIPGVVIRMDEANANLQETRAALVLYNSNGGQYTGSGLTFASREAVGAGNDVALSGIFGIKESVGTAGGWSQGGLRFWTKNMGNIIEAMAIKNDGNVGIGATAPNNNLEIRGASGLRISDPANIYRGSLVFGNLNNNWNSGIRVYDSGDAEMRIWHANASGQIVLATGYNGEATTTMPTDGLFIDQNKVGIGYASPAASTGKLIVNGNVGIGTTAPGTRLEVSGQGRFNSGASFSAIDTGWASSFGYSSGNWGVRLGATGGQGVVQAAQNTTAYNLAMQPYGGNVGIATTTIGVPLDVTSLTAPTGNIIDVNGGHIAGLNSTPVNSDHAVPLGYLQNNYSSTSSSLWSGTKNGNIWNGSAGAGNVGIGTTAPNTKLHVSGSANVTNVLRTGNYRHVLSTGFTSTAVNGYLLTTTIPYDGITNRGMHTIRVQGFSYGTNQPIDFVVNVYLYSVGFSTYNWTNYGAYDPGDVKLSYEGNVLKLWWSNVVYYPSFEVFTTSWIGAYDTDSYFEGWTITDVAAPATNVVNVGYANARPQGLTLGGNIALNGNWLSGDGGGEGVFVDSNGNVGVGLSSLGYKLDVNGNMRVSAGSVPAGYFLSTADTQISLNSTDSWAGIHFNDSGAVNDNLYYNGSYGTFSIGGGGSSISGKKLHVEGGTSIGVSYRSLPVPVNGLSVEGNVGIGTTNPSKKLQVMGDIALNDGSYITGGSNYTSFLTSGNGAQNVKVGALVVSSSYGNTAPASGAYIQGNVGIGTTSPVATLSVQSGTDPAIRVNGRQISGLPLTQTEPDQAVSRGYVHGNFAPLPIGTSTGAYFAQRGNSFGDIAVLGTNDNQRLDLETNDAVRMTVAANGNVGIGITSSNEKLEVAGALRVTGPAASAGGLILSEEGSYKRIQSFDSEPLAINPLGNSVGIGTTSPAAKLHVRDGAATYIARFEGSASSVITVGSASLAGQSNTQYINSLGQVWVGIDNAGLGGLSATSGATGLAFSTGGSERIRINSSGNVGIGTNNPAPVKLDVLGGIKTSRLGSYGTYNSSEVQGIWSISESYPINTGSNNFGAQYGIGYAYNTLAGAPFSGTHQIVFTNSGTVNAAIGLDGKGYFKNNVSIGTVNQVAGLSIVTANPALHVGDRYIAGLDLTPISPDHAVPLRYATTTFFMQAGNSFNTTATLGTNDNQHLNFETNNTVRASITNNGNIGIGTTTPGSRLTLSGGDFEMDHNKSIKISSSTINTTLLLGNYADGSGFTYGTSSTIRSASLAVEGDVKADRLCIEEDCKAAWSEIVTAGGGNQWTTSGNNIYNSNSGNIGIGTSTPSQKLEVIGDIKIEGDSGSYKLKLGSGIGQEFSLGTAWNGFADTLFVNYSAGAGSTVMALQGTGSVGIGTTSPATKLHIYDASSGPVLTMSGLDTNYRGLTIKNTANAEQWFAGNNASNNFVIRRSGSTDHLTIASNGNVGIGTTTPGAMLELFKSGAPELRLTDVGNNYLNGDLQSQIMFYGRWWNGQTFAVNSAAIKILKDANDGSGGSAIAFWTQNQSSTAISEKMRINRNGNVGIGTTADPSAKLEINQQGVFNTTTPGLTKYGLHFGGQTTNDQATGITWNGGAASNNAEAGIYVQGSSSYGSKMYFATTDSHAAGARTRMMIDHGGSVGIGTTNPNSRLVVKGSGSASTTSAFNVTNSADITALFVRNDLTVGIGTTTPVARLAIDGGTGGVIHTGGGQIYGLPNTQISPDQAISLYHATTTFFMHAGNSFGATATIGTNDDHQLNFETNNVARMAITNNGNVGIGTTTPGNYRLKVAGNMVITGTLETQTGSDFAEEFLTTGAIKPGTVVVMGDLGYKSVKVSGRAHDKTVVGVVSDNPSIIAGRLEVAEGESKAIVAMAGVVSVLVSDTNGSIKRGDLLVSSNISGYAMKSDGLVPGTVIGKALEDLKGSRGKIKVLINLQ